MRFNTNKMIATGLVGLTLMATNLYADDKKVVATVNGTDITQETLDTVVGMVGGMPGAQVDTKAIIDDLIITELARQEANKAGLAERQEIKDKIKDATDRLVLNTWTQEKAASFKPSDDELKKAYEERTSGEKLEYKARHILMKTKEEAQSIIKELESKVDFADLAKKSSDGPSANQGGDLGWFKPNTMVKPFADAVAKMEPGTITKEPVQTEFGWHVIKLEERRDVKPPEFDTLKPQLEREYQQKKMLAYMDELKSKADIKVMLPETKPAADAPKVEDKPAEDKPEEKK
ncbi:peptidyl-prolyl cis-trans isomerase C [Thiothrix caldifontis]|uniref:peptidylprolyl isomerase n=1 Tax=Thiothrix caldifontis TaxID=525918 RepID=A0A1H3YHA7_9GAMM|nr:peptidylprolyl isomerase [Thiothrix caldifontis]SEA10571.1 peptidyl-prolyl cis-trans isomerase C [Thiothrix caldifontis]